MMEDLRKIDPKTAFLALRKWETQSIVSFGERLGLLLSEEDILLSFSLLNISGGFLYQERVLAERDGKLGSERWFFMASPQITDFSSKLPKSTKESVEALALKLGIEPEVVMKAAIRTKALAENFKDAIFMTLDNGPEGIRLVEVMLPSTSKDGVFIQPRKGYSLEYYSSFNAQEGKPIRTLLVHINPEEVNFQALFPGVLVFSAHVANKRQLSQSRVEPAAGLS